MTAAFIDRTKAERTWGSWNATANQCVVQPRIGHVSTFDLSKAKSTMVMMGTKRNRRTPTTQAHRPSSRELSTAHSASKAPRRLATTR